MPVIGFLVNPVAGMGGSVGLKGTDGKADEARQRGAVPHAPDRAAIALAALKGLPDLTFLSCSGEMGEDMLERCGISRYRIVYTARGTSTAEDTKSAVRAFIAGCADLILFCGGDGTARDVFAAAGRSVPILGIPAGVKMYSAVFAVDPAAAAGILTGPYTVTDGDVVDVDEEAYRAGTLATRLYGVARVVARAGMTQPAKQVFEEADEERAKEEIARFMAEVMLPDTLYLIGAGTTTEANRPTARDRKDTPWRGYGTKRENHCRRCGREDAPFPYRKIPGCPDHRKPHRGPGVHPWPGQPADQPRGSPNGRDTPGDRCRNAAQAAGDTGPVRGFGRSRNRRWLRAVSPGDLRIPDCAAKEDPSGAVNRGPVAKEKRIVFLQRCNGLLVHLV